MRRFRLRAAAVAAAALSSFVIRAEGRVAFVPPPPGTYELPPIDRIGDHRLVDSDGSAISLRRAREGRLGVVAFVYSSCPEARGCPLSMAALGELDRRLADDPELAGRVSLVTISFDPERDTPERMARWRAAFEPRSPWRFLTARSDAELAPVLEDFGQTAFRLRDEKGQETGLFRHVLKVFLLDRSDRVRNVYSADFLAPEIVMNDLRTLLRETAP